MDCLSGRFAALATTTGSAGQGDDEMANDTAACREALINDLLSVSRSLADWARAEMDAGETAHGVKKRIREAMAVIDRA